MTLLFRVIAAAAAFSFIVGVAHAQDRAADKVKIGLITTLSGPPAVIGQQQRNGLQLALKELGNKLGGRDVELQVQDDELKPDVAVSKVRAFVERDKVDFVVGPVFSNILAAIIKPVTESGAFMISPNAGTSSFAGKDCNPNLFVVSYQNDQNAETMGKYAQDTGLKKVFLMAPNYQAGKDEIAGFKRYYKSDVADEVYVPLNQLDYAAELSKIAAAQPDAIFVFAPGGMGVNFVKQFRLVSLRSSPAAVRTRTPRLIRISRPSSWVTRSRAKRVASSTITMWTPLPSMRSSSAAKPGLLSIGSAPDTAAS